MNGEASWNRALLLARQGRNDLAIEELRRVLTIEPEHVHGLTLLAQLLAERGEDREALDCAQRAIRLAPDLPIAHHALAVVHREGGRLDAAAGSANEAIRLSPDDADHHALLAQIRLNQKRWADALAAADAGLALDPQDTTCLNLRSVALVRLGRKREATDALDASLQHDPDNPYTHQARGFALLNRGDAAGALQHFREALRRDPTLDGARQGLVEAIKARNPLYRAVLAVILWLDRFSAGRQRQILVGAWLAMFLGSRLLDRTGNQGAATTLILVWFGAVMLLSCSVPLFNLLLLLHPIGRHALDTRPRRDALLFGGAIAMLLAVAIHAWFGDSAWSQIGWEWFVVFLLPVAGLGNFESGWARRALQVFCVAMLASISWWLVHFETLIATHRADRAAPQGGSANALVPKALPALQAHYGMFNTLLLLTVASTWFVLLAPKGHRRRGS
jgi:tetratricopeptide (TPR) repeat protein